MSRSAPRTPFDTIATLLAILVGFGFLALEYTTLFGTTTPTAERMVALFAILGWWAHAYVRNSTHWLPALIATGVIATAAALHFALAQKPFMGATFGALVVFAIVHIGAMWAPERRTPWTGPETSDEGVMSWRHARSGGVLEIVRVQGQSFDAHYHPNAGASVSIGRYNSLDAAQQAADALDTSPDANTHGAHA